MGYPERDLFGAMENLLWLIPYTYYVQNCLVVGFKKRAESQTQVQSINRGNLTVKARLTPTDFHPLVGCKTPCYDRKCAPLLLRR